MAGQSIQRYGWEMAISGYSDRSDFILVISGKRYTIDSNKVLKAFGNL